MDIGDDGGLVVTMIITNVILDRRIGKGAATALSFEIRGSFVFTFKDVKGGTSFKRGLRLLSWFDMCRQPRRAGQAQARSVQLGIGGLLTATNTSLKTRQQSCYSIICSCFSWLDTLFVY
uniref:Uncharacterized protein n=1 Tax=Setaria italica TaxID=4555 RepID=K3ZAU5_SETIT